jgi:hypothetical protein
MAPSRDSSSFSASANCRVVTVDQAIIHAYGPVFNIA